MLIKPERYSKNIWNLSIPVLALDIVIFTIYRGELCIVAEKKEQEWKKKYAIPWGIVAKGYSLEENFDNILYRKTWIQGIYKAQLRTFGNVERDPQGHCIAVSYYALVSVDTFLSSVDLKKVEIIRFEDIKKEEWFYDHYDILIYSKKRLQAKLRYSNIAKEILPKKFTFSQLQWVYEVVLEKKFDKRNFQKKFLNLDLIKATKEVDTSTKRPAKLYMFINQDLQEIGIF